ncbi:hypothetical protein PF005_g5152 [Phytophthora fragariae]|uniref:Uncharacterized protein n=1 Tax=Phytophthora fragariae TaxID=53985 RepID=A0A6A3YYB8_9STRA|nr:hypothetical protein PF009_g4230 [Phytophthora fragariae]KAE9022814.1 hypothetical protein PF011_g4280 [Phytophthora fragariae]KAE9128211.1 hypothetical protein PF007_g5339 [Phytophthora fragariae]KAE9128443.1 hypothetical protein PF010_g4509 [Phytophthora fragariae]KAE9151417.1 hypothetical protein PF006_g4294 [Phytophthora fragariae]
MMILSLVRNYMPAYNKVRRRSAVTNSFGCCLLLFRHH